MIPKGKSKQFMRVTVDTEPADAALLEELERESDFPSKREVFLTGLRLLSGLFRARRQGLRPQMLDPKSNKVIDFNWQNIPEVLPLKPARNVSLDRVKESTVRKLLSYAREMQDMDLQRVTATIAQAAWDPSGEGVVDADVFAELIVIAYGKRDDALLSTTRDLIAQLYTQSSSFADLLSQAVHHYRPALDTREVEGRFLSDQYNRLVGENNAL